MVIYIYIYIYIYIGRRINPCMINYWACIEHRVSSLDKQFLLEGGVSIAEVNPALMHRPYWIGLELSLGGFSER